MEKLYGLSVKYTNIDSILQYQEYFQYNYWNFIKYQPEIKLINIIDKIRPTIHTDGEYILLNVRSESRFLFDYQTKMKLEVFLQSKKLPLNLKICDFSIIPVEEQYNLCSKAKIFISQHGAGCTNLIFTQKNCPLIEINFRKHWYCDPVCKSHMNNTISINDKCDGKLTYHNEFHKADYHNLCYLIDKPYFEIEAVEYGGRFLSVNPISKEKIYIDGSELIKLVNDILK
jgi:hypothetical protein